MKKKVLGSAMFALLVGSAFLTFIATSPEPADAAQTVCTSSSPLVGPTFVGNVTVPEGEHCSLDNIEITGSLTVRGSLDTDETVKISGNLNANHASGLSLEDLEVGGNFIADHTTGPSSNSLCGVTVGGNLIIQKSAADAPWSIGGTACDEDGATVGKNFTFQNNEGGGEIGTAFTNTVGGNLDCHNNTPAPTVGSNTVAGKTKGQCAP